jgi:glucokinase
MYGFVDDESRLAIVGDVGRRAVRLGLTDAEGRLRRDTIRSYGPGEESTIAGALATFGRAHDLPRLPRRCAIAVSGAPVGETIAITNSRWFISRSGLRAMLQAEPLILNDFAANAWALTMPHGTARWRPLDGPAPALEAAGTTCLIGVGSGLGVAVIARDGTGRAHVLPTEAGHCHFMAGSPDLAPVLAGMADGRGPLTGERLLSADGLAMLYRWYAGQERCAVRGTSPIEIARSAAGHGDRAARLAVEAFGAALWYFAGNMALAYGAWSGVVLTGSVTAALRDLLRQPALTQHFQLHGPHRRALAMVPRATVELDHGELEGAAQALLAA